LAINHDYKKLDLSHTINSLSFGEATTVRYVEKRGFLDENLHPLDGFTFEKTSGDLKA
jgi:hypothetical protein